MRSLTRSIVAAACAAGTVLGAAGTASAGDYNGDFMVRIGGSVVAPDTDAKVFNGGALMGGADADVSTEVIPSATLTYFLNKNLAVELFCCFAKHEAKAKGTIAAIGDLGDFWIFPPALTLQYHFDGLGALKPYVGAGLQYIHFFGEGRSAGLGAPIKLDDAIGFTLQAGIDLQLGNGWYLNADVKKTWIDTEASWTGTTITADVDVDPWIISANIGYRFNLSDIFGRREVAYEPLK